MEFRTQLCWQRAGLGNGSRVDWMLTPVRDTTEPEKYKFGMRCVKCIRHKEDPTVKGRGGPCDGRTGVHIK